MTPRTHGWLVDTVVGVLVGGVVGAIVSVNIVIYAGPDAGYESGVADVFEHNVVVGLVTGAALVLGSMLGVVTAPWIRRRSAA